MHTTYYKTNSRSRHPAGCNSTLECSINKALCVQYLEKLNTLIYLRYFCYYLKYIFDTFLLFQVNITSFLFACFENLNVVVLNGSRFLFFQDGSCPVASWESVGGKKINKQTFCHR